MANPGIGFRTVNDLLVEASFHLLQPIAYTTLTSPVTAGAGVNAQVGSTSAMYAGALLVVDTGASQEIVTVSAVGTTGSPPIPIFTATFAKSHSAGVVVWAATFPLQAATDPLYTQAEMLLYLSRAENQFLMDCPCYFQINHQTVSTGHIIQSSPSAMVEMERVAVFNPAVAINTLTRTSNIVTATTVNSSPHGFSVGQKFSIYGAGAGWDGAFIVASIVSPSSWTYIQIASNGSASGGNAGLWLRLYELTEEELTMQDPTWRVQNISVLKSWYEDRTGNYSWGVNGVPSSNFTVETLSTIRDSDTLVLTDGFLVPDPFLHFVKYKMLNYAWSKEGEARNPLLASYAEMRYQRGVMAVLRWLGAMGVIAAAQSLANLTSQAKRKA